MNIIYDNSYKFHDIFTSPQGNLPFSKIQEIALKFKISVLVVAIRLRHLGLIIPYISYTYSS